MDKVRKKMTTRAQHKSMAERKMMKEVGCREPTDQSEGKGRESRRERARYTRKRWAPESAPRAEGQEGEGRKRERRDVGGKNGEEEKRRW